MRCNFFAAEDDLYVVLEQVERARGLHYAKAGLHPNVSVRTESSWRAFLVPGSPTESFLVFEPKFPLVVRPVPQNAGGALYAVDELANSNAVSVVPGRIATPLLLLPGVIGSAAPAGPAASLVRA
jgi:hypothetical protein